MTWKTILCRDRVLSCRRSDLLGRESKAKKYRTRGTKIREEVAVVDRALTMLAPLNASMQGGVGVSGRGTGLRSLPLRARAASGRRATASFALGRKSPATHEQDASKMMVPSTVVVEKEAGEVGKPKAMPER